jgi:hypothetical protein
MRVPGLNRWPMPRELRGLPLLSWPAPTGIVRALSYTLPVLSYIKPGHSHLMCGANQRHQPAVRPQDHSMPTKKAKPNAGRTKPPPTQEAQQDTSQQDPGPRKDSTMGLTGRGADSALVHLIEQEKTRDRKPEGS